MEYVFHLPSDVLGMGSNRYLSLCRQPPADDGWPLFFAHVGLRLVHPWWQYEVLIVSGSSGIQVEAVSRDPEQLLQYLAIQSSYGRSDPGFEHY